MSNDRAQNITTCWLLAKIEFDNANNIINQNFNQLYFDPPSSITGKRCSMVLSSFYCNNLNTPTKPLNPILIKITSGLSFPYNTLSTIENTSRTSIIGIINTSGGGLLMNPEILVTVPDGPTTLQLDFENLDVTTARDIYISLTFRPIE